MLTIEASAISGELFCNRYGGGLEYTADGSFTISEAFITTAMCGPAEDEAVAAVVGFLGRVAEWDLSDDGNSLSLGSEHGEELLLQRI